MGFVGFLKARHHSADPVVRRKWVKGLRDAPALIDLASKDPDLEVRLLAVDRMTGETALKEVALHGEHLDARLKAARRISDPRVLADIMRERKNPDLMLACFEGIRDQEVLAEIAGDPRQSVTARRIAINMFADQELVLKVLRTVREPSLRRAALEKVTDGDLRERLRSEVEEHVRVGRIDRILEHYDPEVVAEMLGAFRESRSAVKALGTLAARGGAAGERAVEILTRQLKHARADIRLEALHQLAAAKAVPADMVSELAEEDPDRAVRQAAADLTAAADEG